MTVLKTNDQELPVLADMFHLRGDTSEQLRELALRFQLSLAALTRGARGSLLYSQARFSDYPGTPVKVVDCVGAGDAFTAAMTLGLLAGWDLDEINRRANELAAYVCSQDGSVLLVGGQPGTRGDALSHRPITGHPVRERSQLVKGLEGVEYFGGNPELPEHAPG
ncbi:MAG: PfkB family carbohydrate kinase [Verrucomicrobiota bacterium]